MLNIFMMVVFIVHCFGKQISMPKYLGNNFDNHKAIWYSHKTKIVSKVFDMVHLFASLLLLNVKKQINK